MNRMLKEIGLAGVFVWLVVSPGATRASSHMDAPLITLDPSANTTDVYAFLSQREGKTYLTAALTVYPFEEPGIGPNDFRFDDNVLYQIHVATGPDVEAGRATYSYQFRFTTEFRRKDTILQAYLGVIQQVGDTNQNLVQRYTVTRVNNRTGAVTVLGQGIVPPNNQGNATPLYNQGDNGEMPAKGGVATEAALDSYTRQALAPLRRGHRAFAGQRDDGFYADVQAVFDLLKIRPPGQAQDSQKGFDVHTLVIEIPLSELREAHPTAQLAGVYATTSRPTVPVLRGEKEGNGGEDRDEKASKDGGKHKERFVQVGRQGNPLFCEVFVAIADKDHYNQTSPTEDRRIFAQYALNPEPARLLNALVFHGPVAPESNRTDIAAIYIPDLIKVDLTTGPARLAGGGAGDPSNPDDSGFSRLSIFGGDTLVSRFQPGIDGKGTIPGGWPNGRRFGDDVIDIGLTAVASDLRTTPPTIHDPVGDNVDRNDIAYNKVLPYAATPLNGRVHEHHGGTSGGSRASLPDASDRRSGRRAPPSNP